MVSASLNSDERIGRYRVLRLLATGGMGELFLARSEGPAGFSKTVVIKRILRHLAADLGFIEMFQNEARVAALLQHPNVVQVFALEHEGDAWFISMEYVHGRSLGTVLQRLYARSASHLTAPLAPGRVPPGPWVPPRVAAQVTSQVLRGLHYAHTLKSETGEALGILHRDVSPDNVLLAFSGTAKLVDFGIAKAVNAANVTRGGPLKGKVAYMAPEHFAASGRVDARADLYAMAVVLHELCTGDRPACVPRSPDDAALPRKPYTPHPSIPAALNALLTRALQPEAQQRFDSAAQFADALDAFERGEGGTVDTAAVAQWLTGLFADELERPTASDSLSPVGRTAVLGAPGSHRTEVNGPPLSAEEAARAAPVMQRRPLWPILTAAVVGLGILVPMSAVLFSRAPFGVKEPQPLPPPLPVAKVKPNDVVMPVINLSTPTQGESEQPEKVEKPVAKPAPARPPRKKPPVKTGRLIVKATLPTEVFIGGKSYGTTPLGGPIEVPAGTLSLMLRNKQGSTKRMVKVPAGVEVTVKAEAAPKR